ncbi:MAG: metallophosphoesterase, partial [Rhodobacteraceae bacterium]|nr:metallophosphoesterase [Paracoccaceae bacterium]
MPALHFKSEWLPLPTGLEDGVEIFAVGDVHGYCSHLQTMLEVFSEARDSQKQSILVSLGDLIDRGPESIRALDLMRKSKDFGFTETHTLMGNHEQLMRLSLSGKKMTEFTRYIPANAHTPAHEIWSWNGAGKTLRELGLNPEDMF